MRWAKPSPWIQAAALMWRDIPTRPIFSPRSLRLPPRRQSRCNVSVTVTNSSGTSSPVTAVAQMFQPAFFHWGNYAVATRTDYTLAVTAKPGEVIILWGTGFGPTSPPAPTGIVVPFGTPYNTVNAVTVTVGPAAAVVYGAALTSGEAGLYQVAIQIPTTLADGDYPIVATVSGAQSPASTLITVQK